MLFRIHHSNQSCCFRRSDNSSGHAPECSSSHDIPRKPQVSTCTCVESYHSKYPIIRIKVEAAEGQCRVNVKFWGGVIPGNTPHLREMVSLGVPGFKCFLIHSGVDEFPAVSKDQVIK